MKERDLAIKIKKLGGTLYIVGGWIRNKLAGIEPKDKDYLIVGLDVEIWENSFTDWEKIGNNFPVYLVNIDGKKSEIALARKEKKVTSGYKGFIMEFNSEITLEEDLFRRDTKANSIAYKVLTGEIFDPYNGIEDIKNKILSPVSSHFIEDPVRTLRIARQACELNFTITQEGYEYMAQTRRELALEPTERIFAEMVRALKTKKPSEFFRILQRGKVLDVIFPEIAQMQGQIQPEVHHPEGDAYEHLLKTIDDIADISDSILARYCGLVHDLGKGITPKEILPHHYGHEVVGVEVLENWNSRMTMPKQWIKAGKFVITTHMKAARLTKPGKILDLLLELSKMPITIEEYTAVILVDSGVVPWYLQEAVGICEAVSKVDMSKLPSNFHGKKIGEWIRQRQLILFQEYIKQIKGKYPGFKKIGE